MALLLCRVQDRGTGTWGQQGAAPAPGEGSADKSRLPTPHCSCVGQDELQVSQEQVQSPAPNTRHSSVLPFPADAHRDAEGDLAEVELLPAPPRQENKQIPDTQQGQLCQNHQILFYFSSQLARPQHRERHKHSTETAQGFSLLTLGYSLHSTALWKTFQACLAG